MQVRIAAAGAATILTLCVIALGLVGTAHTSAQSPWPQGAAAKYIVVLHDYVGNTDGEVDQLERFQNFRSLFRYRLALKGFAAVLTPAQVQALSRLPQVDFISPDYEVHATDSVPLASGDTARTGVQRIEAATATTVRQASNVNVAVIDTGVDLNHPDLNTMDGENCISTSSSATSQDDNGHGTHVAGIIGAENNGSGVTGVVPNTKIVGVKVLDANGSGYWSQVICGIDWVTANAAALNIKVANMSLGGGGSNDGNCGLTNNDALHQAICDSVAAGVTYVVAAGNDSANFANSVPASYPEVLTVTAVSDSDGKGGGTGGNPSCRSGEQDDRYASYSSFAVSSADIAHTIAAPGTCIYSTYLTTSVSGPWYRRTTTFNHTYGTLSGTSMATPHVTGSVALCIGDGGDAGPCAGMSPAQIIQQMRLTAQTRSSTPGYGFTGDPNATVSGRYYGYMVADGVPPAPDFSIGTSPASRTVTAGGNTSYTVTATSLAGFSSAVGLTVSGAPAGVTPSFTPNPSVTPTGSSTLNITTTGAAAPGSYTLTITGMSGSLVHSTTVTLVVQAAPVPDFSISASPGSRTVTRGDGTSYSVSLTSLNGFSSSVDLTVSGAPSGVGTSFTSGSVTPTGSSTLNITTLASTAPGSYTLTITGQSGSLVHSTTVTLVVQQEVQGDFTMTVSPSSRTLVRFFGQTTTTYTVTLQASGGYNSPVTLSVTGLGTGVTGSFSPNPVTPTSGGATATLTVVASGSATRGSRTFTVTGTGSDATAHSTTASLTVY